MGAAALGRAPAGRRQRGPYGGSRVGVDACDRVMRAIRKAPVGASMTEVAAIAGISGARLYQVSLKLVADGAIIRETVPGARGRPRTYLIPSDDSWLAIGLPIMTERQEEVIEAIREIGPRATPTQIGGAVGISPSAVCWTIKCLEEKGLIERQGRGRGRLLIILDDED